MLTGGRVSWVGIRHLLFRNMEPFWRALPSIQRDTRLDYSRKPYITIQNNNFVSMRGVELHECSSSDRSSTGPSGRSLERVDELSHLL